MEEHDKRILRDTLNRRALDLKEKFEEERKLVKGLAKEDKRRKELKKTRKISPRLCLTLPRVF
jgi:hypothetical protein